jgi:hypothetical protein
MVLQLLDKEESAQDFDQLSPAIRQGLEQEALSLKREQRLVAVTDSLRRDTHPFEIRDDVLKRIPWPPVAALN